jgi:hypothetical protein
LKRGYPSAAAGLLAHVLPRGEPVDDSETQVINLTVNSVPNSMFLVGDPPRLVSGEEARRMMLEDQKTIEQVAHLDNFAEPDTSEIKPVPEPELQKLKTQKTEPVEPEREKIDWRAKARFDPSIEVDEFGGRKPRG